MEREFNFTIAEMTRSYEALKGGIENTPTQEQLRHMCRTLDVLEGVREWYGKPILISSGFRSEQLNARIGGAKNSRHMEGKAADIVPQGTTEDKFDDLARAIDLVMEEGKLSKVIVEAKRRVDGSMKYWFHLEVVEGEKPMVVGLLNNKSIAGLAMRVSVIKMLRRLRDVAKEIEI